MDGVTAAPRSCARRRSRAGGSSELRGSPNGGFRGICVGLAALVAPTRRHSDRSAGMVGYPVLEK
jgi:hypothetical protein